MSPYFDIPYFDKVFFDKAYDKPDPSNVHSWRMDERTSSAHPDLVVLADVDGVFADLVTAVCDVLREAGYNRTPEDIKHFDFALSLTQEEHCIVREAMHQPGFCWDIPAYTYARDWSQKIAATPGVELLFVTAPYPSPTWQRERLEWIRYVLQADSNRVLSVSSHFKKYVRGDILIEDKASTIHDWLEVNRQGVGILFDRPWNQPTAREYVDHPRMHRMHGFEDIVRFIQAKAEQKAAQPPAHLQMGLIKSRFQRGLTY